MSYQPFCALCAHDGKEQDCDVASKQAGEKCTSRLARDEENRLNRSHRRVTCDRTKKSASTLRANAAKNQNVLAASVAAPTPAPVAAQVVPVINQYYMAGPEPGNKRKASDEGGLSNVVQEQARKIVKLEKQLEQPPGVSRREAHVDGLERCLDDAVMARVNAEVEVQELRNQLAGEKKETESLWVANRDLRRQVQGYERNVPHLRERRDLEMEVSSLQEKVKALKDQVKGLGGDLEVDEGKREEVKGEEVMVKKEVESE
ncbi:hypothetical protein LTS10_006532 [Elasticomyces elasticus]|nr:hypothetical protein LTS10_006532 [Elasticomyces elasticus]